ncbi:hypothetical protein J1C49_16715 [Cognatishimia sp. F0-27]|nr:hypothetical protein [Cognatishimia sp. F0-27]
MLPAPLDCETQMLLRRFLSPILETAPDWPALARALQAKGYGLGFRAGHLVILREQGEPLCTGRSLGVPLRSIAARIGRPALRGSADGLTAELDPR